MKTKLALLSRRSTLWPGESLPSFLVRLEDLNHYTRGMLGWLCHREASRGDLAEQDDIMRPKQPLTFAQLAALTGLTAPELFAASDHRLAPTLIPPEEDKPSITLPSGETKLMVNIPTYRRRIRPTSSAQFCPLCLKEAAYHRLSWTPIAAAICLQHQCLLVRHCPQCGKRVTVAEVVRKQCRECEANLCETPVESVSGDAVGMMSQQWLQFWLAVAPEPARSVLPKHTWPDVSPMALYRLMDGLRWSLIACQEEWPNLTDPLAGLSGLIREKVNNREALSPVSSYYLYRAAFQTILDWPQEFHRFLDAYSQRDRQAQTVTGLGLRLGSLFTRWIQKAWLRPEFEFIQHAFGGYLLSGRISLVYALRYERFRNDERLADQWGLLNWEQTLQVLDIPAGALTRLTRSGSLRAAWWPAGETGLWLFQRDKVLEVEQRWKEGISLGEASRWLGLLAQVIVKLAKLDALTLSRGSLAESTSNWLFSKQSLVEFVETVDCNLKATQISPPLVPLHAAAERLRCVHLDAATLLKRVADGQLVGYKSRAWLSDLSSVYFLESAVKVLLKVMPLEQGWYTDRDVAKRVGVNVGVVAKWIHTDLITPIAKCGEVYYFDQETAEMFCANCLTSAEAAQVLGMDTKTMMQELVHTGRLDPIARPSSYGCRGYIFYRHEVASLRSEE